MSILLAAIAAARARKNRATVRSEAARLVVSLLCPFFLSENFPFAFFNLPNQRAPRFCLRIKGKLVGQLAVLGVEMKFDAQEFFIHLPVPERRVTGPKNIHPVTNIILRSVIESDIDECLVVRSGIAGSVMKFNELMFQHPLAMNARLHNAIVANLAHFVAHVSGGS